jgi:hypothetical protein
MVLSPSRTIAASEAGRERDAEDIARIAAPAVNVGTDRLVFGDVAGGSLRWAP